MKVVSSLLCSLVVLRFVGRLRVGLRLRITVRLLRMRLSGRA